MSCEISTEKVFHNQYVTQKIFNFLTDDIMSQLDIRRLNKACNAAFLGIIRKKYRAIKIELINEKGSGYEFDEELFINYTRIQKSTQDVDRFFRFLTDAANVKVEKIEVKNLFGSTRWGNLHDSIISTLIENNRDNLKTLKGINGICATCIRCLDLIQKCQEYGPLNSYRLNSIKTSCHFKKLIIDEELLDDLANRSVSEAQSKEDCYRELDKRVKDIITCDTLVFQIRERRIAIRQETREREKHWESPFPWEVLEFIIKKWKVKSISIKYVFVGSPRNYWDKWCRSGYFKKFRFNNSYDLVEKCSQNWKFTHVDIDLRDSLYCIKDLMDSENVEELKGYDNLIGNIRKTFPTENINIISSHWYHNSYGTIPSVINSIINTITKEDPSNLTVNFKYYPKIESFSSIMPSLITQFYPYQFKISIQDPLLHSYHRTLKGTHYPKKFQKEKYIGKRIKIRDDQSNCQVNFDIFVNENDLFEIPKELINVQPNAFIRHFFHV